MAGMRKLAPVSLLIAAAASMGLYFQAGPFAQAPEFVEDTEAYAVYAVFLHAIAQGDQYRGREIKLFQETRPPRGCMQEGTIPPEWQPAMEDFRKANVRPRLLKDGIDLGTPHLLVTPLIIKAMIAGATPRPEPTLSVAVSAVGFNAEKTFALVYHEGECGVNARDGTIGCSKGGVTPLTKVAGRWELSRNVEACTWIARHNLQGTDQFARRNPLPARLSNRS